MESNELLKKVSEALGKKASEKTAEKQQQEKERRELVTSIGGDITESLRPYMESMAKQSQITKEDLKAALSEVTINVPESHINMPEIRVPESRIKVELPEIKLPQFNIPQANIQYPDMMRVQMDGVDKLKPLPVMMMDTKGNPFQFPIAGGGGGGKSDFFTIKGITNTIGIVSINPDGSPAGSGSVASAVSVTDIFGTIGTNVVNPDGRLKVELPTGSSGLTDTELRATSLTINQLSGANWSVSVSDIFGSTGTGFYNLDNRLRVEVPTYTQPISVTDIFATTATSNVVNADNRVKVELPAQTVTVSSITASTGTNVVDSSGIAYSGSNPLPTTLVSGGITSTLSIGDSPARTADNGGNPVKIGGIARTTNPIAYADGDRSNFSSDKIGRQLVRPVQVRDLIKTAYLSVATGTETTLLAGVAGAFLDLIMIVASNNSDAAVSVDLRANTAGSIVDTLRIPANGTAGFTLPVPWPVSDTGGSWTVDGPDETGRTLTFSALFSQEI